MEIQFIIGAIFFALVAFLLFNRKKPEVAAQVVEEVKAVEKVVVEEVKAVETAVVEEVKEVVKKVRKPRATPATPKAKKPAAKKAVAKKPATSKKA
jgi:BRCT domain type II-containing protein